MSDEAVSAGHEQRRAAQSGEEELPLPQAEDALEALRNIVFGTRLDEVTELRERMARVESLRTLLERLEGRADRAQEESARALAERAEVAEALTRRLAEAEAYARRVETEAAEALAEREAADELLAERADASEALAERVEGPGGLRERVDGVERLADRVDDVERLARRVEGIEELDRRVRTVEEVRARVVDEDLRAEDVSAVLPRAVAVRGRQDGQLAASLRPTIEDTLEASVRRNPQALVDIIFPVLGPAIRKMIGSAITSMVGTINRAVESSFTIRGLKWRVQAWRTKRSYAEIALMHGLVYRVEQLFLIQRDSGLLLAHATRNPADADEPEAISGMLTAITDFVRDSFNVESGSEVETFRVGDLTLIAKGGPKAVLAATVRGVPPPALHDALSTTIEHVHRDYGQAIDAFDGDVESLAGVEALLEPNLVAEAKERKQRGPASLIFWVLLAVILATVLASIITRSMRASRVERDVRALARTLSAEEGIVVTGVHERGGRWVIEGLRDPLAAEPAGLLDETALDADDVELRIGPFRSLEPAFVKRRVMERVHIPETVQATWRGLTLVLTGPTYSQWIGNALKIADDVEGVEGVDISGLVADPTLDALLGVRAVLLTKILGTAERPGDDVIEDVRKALAGAREAAGGRYDVRLLVIPLVRRIDDEPAARALATQLVERLEQAGAASTIRFRGPADLARPRPGDLMPTGTAAEIRFDLAITLAGDAGR